MTPLYSDIYSIPEGVPIERCHCIYIDKKCGRLFGIEKPYSLMKVLTVLKFKTNFVETMGRKWEIKKYTNDCYIYI